MFVLARLGAAAAVAAAARRFFFSLQFSLHLSNLPLSSNSPRHVRHHLDQPRQRDRDVDGRRPGQRRTGAEPGGKAQRDRGARRADGGAQVPAEQERRERVERGRVGLKWFWLMVVLR